VEKIAEYDFAPSTQAAASSGKIFSAEKYTCGYPQQQSPRVPYPKN
jgi:hypothetical protein